MPINGKIAGTDVIKVGQRRGGSMAATIHSGSPAKAFKAHQALQTWMTAHNKTPRGDALEIYQVTTLNTPLSKFKTEVLYPIKP